MINDWHDFFFAVICSTGSLLGLFFVAISICIPKITSTDIHKASMQPLILLLGVLMSSSLFLVPRQPLELLGLEVIVTGIFIGGVLLWSSFSLYKKKLGHRNIRLRRIFNLVFNMIYPILLVISGLVIYTKGYVGVYFMVPAILLSYFKISINAWAMLIVVHRSSDNNSKWGDITVKKTEKDDEI